MKAIICPYCNEVNLVETFARHVTMVHSVDIPSEVDEAYIEKRFRHLGGVTYGVLDEKGKFKPALTNT